MRRIELDTASWIDLDDFYSALLPALGAPSWHGHNFDALWDSMVQGGINDLQPPYEINLVNTFGLGEPLRSKLIGFLDLVREARERKGIDIHATAEPPL